MGEVNKDNMFQRIKLLFDGSVDIRVAVAQQVAPPAADNIQITVAVWIIKVRACRMVDNDGRQCFVIFHLRTGMPDVGKISCC